MKKQKSVIGYFIIGSSILWGLTIIACSLALKGTGNFDKISQILGVAAALHIIIIWGPLAAKIKKQKDEYAQNKNKDKVEISE